MIMDLNDRLIHSTMVLRRPSPKQDHLRMNVAPSQACSIISGLQIILEHRSLSSIGQKMHMILADLVVGYFPRSQDQYFAHTKVLLKEALKKLVNLRT